MIGDKIKKINADGMITLYIILVLITVILLLGFVGYLVLFILPKIITTEIYDVPINNDTYPILLQALIIVAGVVLGLVSAVFIEALKKLDRIIVSKLGKSIILFGLLFIFMIPAFLIILSIAFSINGMLYYSIVNTYITTQINTGIIHTEIGGNVILINSTYFNNIKSNVTRSIKNYYTSLVSNTQLAINTLFGGFLFWLAFIVAYAGILFYTYIIVNKKSSLSHI